VLEVDEDLTVVMDLRLPVLSKNPTTSTRVSTVPERLCSANDLVLVELSAGMTMPEAVWWAARLRLDTAATLAPAR
jgi:Flp pilus assembly protein TadB